MLAGLIVTLAYMVLNVLNPNFNLLGITNVAAGVFGVITNFAVTIGVSLRQRQTSPETLRLVESLRQPG